MIKRLFMNNLKDRVSTHNNIATIAPAHLGEPLELPLFSAHVQAGFPSPADDHIEHHLDLNKHLIKHPQATFFVRVSGDSMQQAGIHNNDMLIVDRSLTAKHGSIISAAIDGQLTVKSLSQHKGVTKLIAEHPDYPDIHLKEGEQLHVWGVVSYVIHQV